MQPLRFIGRWGWRLILIAVVFFNARLYAPSPLATANSELPKHLLRQLNANRSDIESGAPTSMQSLFPEGYYFCHVLHGLTWIEAALRDPQLKSQAIAEARLAIAALESANGKAPFPPGLPPDHGMFYAAWKADLQAGILLLSGVEAQSQKETLAAECDAIAKALRESPTPFLASYKGSVWPCDTLPAIHALVAYDRITQEERYGQVVQQWLADVHQRLDPATGLIGHTASLPNGHPVGGARATSQVIVLRFLADIDPEFAREQYTRFRVKFLTSFVGIPCVLEYPTGVTGWGDVDSGPLIFGRSISGTVLMMGIAQMYGDIEQADAIAQAGEVVGLPWTSQNEKSYAGRVLPVGNIIVAYSHVARPWFAGSSHLALAEQKLSWFWRWKVHAASSCLFLPTLVLWWRTRKVSASNCPDQAKAQG